MLISASCNTPAKHVAGLVMLSDAKDAWPVTEGALKNGEPLTLKKLAPKEPDTTKSFGPNAQTSTAPKRGAITSPKPPLEPTGGANSGLQLAMLLGRNYEQFTTSMMDGALIAAPVLPNPVLTP